MIDELIEIESEDEDEILGTEDNSADYIKNRQKKPKNPKKNPLAFLIPSKGDAQGEKTRKIVLLSSIAAGLVVVCAVFAGSAINANKDDGINDALRAIKEDQTSESETTTAAPVTEPEPEPNPAGNTEILPQWAELYAQNKDLVGWVKIDGTYIDYPVVQRIVLDGDGQAIGTNDYYLDHNFKGEKSNRGTVFVDWHVPLVSELHRPDNTVLYGHNMVSDYGDGKYFAFVTNYFAQYKGNGTYKEHPTITFETIYDNKRTTYKIFAGIFANTEEKHGEVFNYYRVRTIDSEDVFYDFIGKVMDRSTFYTDVDIEYGDEFLTLSTCYFPLGNDIDTRYALFARRVRPGEDESVNTDGYSLNPSPLYFDYYYKTIGGSWQGRNWDTSKIKGFDEYTRKHGGNSEG